VGLIADVGVGPVAVDTALFIYFIEEHEAYLPLVEALFTEVAHYRLAAVTSAVTLLEVLVVPYRAGDEHLARRYEALLTRSRGLTLTDLSHDQLRAAAQLRAVRPQIRTPDALQLVAALATRCTALVTNDRRMPSLPSLPVLQLSDYLEGR
jgi:predicted nucleic acid-binding protein